MTVLELKNHLKQFNDNLEVHVEFGTAVTGYTTLEDVDSYHDDGEHYVLLVAGDESR